MSLDFWRGGEQATAYAEVANQSGHILLGTVLAGLWYALLWPLGLFGPLVIGPIYWLIKEVLIDGTWSGNARLKRDGRRDALCVAAGACVSAPLAAIAIWAAVLAGVAIWKVRQR